MRYTRLHHHHHHQYWDDPCHAVHELGCWFRLCWSIATNEGEREGGGGGGHAEASLTCSDGDMLDDIYMTDDTTATSAFEHGDYSQSQQYSKDSRFFLHYQYL